MSPADVTCVTLIDPFDAVLWYSYQPEGLAPTACLFIEAEMSSALSAAVGDQ